MDKAQTNLIYSDMGNIYFPEKFGQALLLAAAKHDITKSLSNEDNLEEITHKYESLQKDFSTLKRLILDKDNPELIL